MSEEAAISVETQVYRGVLRAILVAVAVLLVVGGVGWFAYSQATGLSYEECVEENADRLIDNRPSLDCY